MNVDEELRDEERAELFAFVDGPVPDGFAERVLGAWAEDEAVADVASEPAASAVPLWRRRSVRNAVAAIVSVAAAVLVAWWARDAMVQRTEARERAARLAAPDVDPPPVLARMRADAHGMLSEHCAPCHDSTDHKAEGDALDVFDVRADRWWLTMSDRQLQAVVDRMASRDNMSAADVDGITDYIRAELDFRGAGHS